MRALNFQTIHGMLDLARTADRAILLLHGSTAQITQRFRRRTGKINNLADWTRTCFHLFVIPSKRRLGMAENNGKDWRELCVAASQELDSDKLFSLVNQ